MMYVRAPRTPDGPGFCAPAWAQYYLDCIDRLSVELCEFVIGELKPRAVVVSLWRGGECVGEVRVELP